MQEMGIKIEMTSGKDDTETSVLSRIGAFSFKTTRDKNTQEGKSNDIHMARELGVEEKKAVWGSDEGDEVLLYFIIREESNSSYSEDSEPFLIK